LTVFFVLLGSERVKAERKMMATSTPGFVSFVIEDIVCFVLAKSLS